MTRKAARSSRPVRSSEVSHAASGLTALCSSDTSLVGDLSNPRLKPPLIKILREGDRSLWAAALRLLATQESSGDVPLCVDVIGRTPRDGDRTEDDDIVEVALNVLRAHLGDLGTITYVLGKAGHRFSGWFEGHEYIPFRSAIEGNSKRVPGCPRSHRTSVAGSWGSRSRWTLGRMPTPAPTPTDCTLAPDRSTCSDTSRPSGRSASARPRPAPS